MILGGESMNSQRGEHKIELADGEYTLVYKTNACCKIEEVVTDKSVWEAASSSKITDIRAVLWAGLLHENPNITIERVGTLMDGINLIDLRDNIVEAMSKGIARGLGIEEDEEPGESEPPPYKGAV